MHRFLPALLGNSGAKIAEIEVSHHPRRYGKSKYGLMRTFKVILDLLTVKFFGSFATKPIYVFGGGGIERMQYYFTTYRPEEETQLPDETEGQQKDLTDRMLQNLAGMETSSGFD